MTPLAQSGADGKSPSRGNGYSGGGNGLGTKGGSGSGLDLSSLPFTSVTLIPRAGGNNFLIYRGGEGGVLVNGGSPDADATENQGKGYGGGHRWGHSLGFQVVIILEIQSDD